MQTHHATDTTTVFLTEQQVADTICQSVRTLQKWRSLGTGPDFYKFGQSVRYKISDLEKWIEARRNARGTHYVR